MKKIIITGLILAVLFPIVLICLGGLPKVSGGTNPDIENKIIAATKDIEATPTNSFAYQVRAFQYMNKKDYTAALKDIEKAIEINPSSSSHMTYKAEILAAMGDNENAIKEYQKVCFYYRRMVWDKSLSDNFELVDTSKGINYKMGK